MYIRWRNYILREVCTVQFHTMFLLRLFLSLTTLCLYSFLFLASNFLIFIPYSLSFSCFMFSGRLLYFTFQFPYFVYLYLYRPYRSVSATQPRISYFCLLYVRILLKAVFLYFQKFYKELFLDEQKQSTTNSYSFAARHYAYARRGTVSFRNSACRHPWTPVQPLYPGNSPCLCIECEAGLGRYRSQSGRSG